MIRQPDFIAGKHSVICMFAIINIMKENICCPHLHSVISKAKQPLFSYNLLLQLYLVLFSSWMIDNLHFYANSVTIFIISLSEIVSQFIWLICIIIVNQFDVLFPLDYTLRPLPGLILKSINSYAL